MMSKSMKNLVGGSERSVVPPDGKEELVLEVPLAGRPVAYVAEDLFGSSISGR